MSEKRAIEFVGLMINSEYNDYFMNYIREEIKKVENMLTEIEQSDEPKEVCKKYKEASKLMVLALRGAGLEV